MDISERAIATAEAYQLAEIERRVAGIRDAVAAAGETACRDCDEPIGAARRLALPSATRCILCQADHERKVRR